MARRHQPLLLNLFDSPPRPPLRLLFLSLIGTSLSLDNGIAKTPPMGFNSYMAGPSLRNEEGLRRAADFIISSGMRELGYVYINTDEGWEVKERKKKSANNNASSKKSRRSLEWNTTLYPSGMPDFISSLHRDSLKFGIYGAASGVTCGENPGQLYYEMQDAKTFASWGVDFLKSDNCASYALDSSVRYRAMRDALNASGRSILLSIEPFSINPDPAQASEVANMWRTGVDIDGEYGNFMDKADVADKWAPLAGPHLGWNDPDMINVRNSSTSKDDGGLTLGENRIYFGLWAIMKAPLLISSNLPMLSVDVFNIITNPNVIQVNQDVLGIPARKIEVDAKPLPWLVGLEDCSFHNSGTAYSRQVAWEETQGPSAGPGTTDTRKWIVKKYSKYNDSPKIKAAWLIQNTATRRCLSVANGTDIVLLPCKGSLQNQLWIFEKGISTVTSITHLGTGKALAVSDSYLYSQIHDKDRVSVSDMAYGLGGLTLVDTYNQPNCTSRWCENYQPEQMWYYSSYEGFLRHALYTSSINHIRDSKQGQEDGYVLTQKVPTFRHHCLAHVLSTGNVGTKAGSIEVWGGPLDGGDFVIGLLNRGTTPANITPNLDLLLESSGHRSSAIPSECTEYAVLDMWKSSLSSLSMTGRLTMEVPPHDIALLRLTRMQSQVDKS